MRRLLLLLLLLPCLASAHKDRMVDGITIVGEKAGTYIPVKEAAELLHWSYKFDPVVELVDLKGKTLDPFTPMLSDGTPLVSLATLKAMGASVRTHEAMKGYRLSDGKHSFVVRISPKRVAVDLTKQVLDAWQGDRLVYHWPVSSGREGKETPNGRFKAGKKEDMHISTIYGSPMPFSVHVTGGIFIHGSASFGSTPGSHGCIRLPLIDRRNVAEEFYNWIDEGSPIRVTGAWPGFSKHRAK